MIKAKAAIAAARERIGTPYREMDCIALIRDVIRRSAGGARDYRCEGTNWLWRSIGNSGKYRHLTWRQEGTQGACAGMLAFKRSGEDIHHVGLVTDAGTVIHASSASGCVVETPLDDSWDCIARHRYLLTADTQSRAEETESKEIREKEESPAHTGLRITIIDAAGRRFEPDGDWRVLIGGID